MQTMTETQAFAQGARCGHIEGKGRAGSYIIEEEIDLSWEAADNGCLDTNIASKAAWARGYRHGYRLAAEGSELEPCYLRDEHAPYVQRLPCGHVFGDDKCDDSGHCEAMTIYRS